MSDTTYSRWYREGTVTISQNSKTVQGANTYWLNANIKPGDLFSLDSSKFYEVDTVDSNTQITLRTAFEESSVTAVTYKIIRNFTATLAAETAAKVVEVLAKTERYVNEDMKTVQGYSAYDLACQGGYVGSVEQWLASLTAYGVARTNGFTGSKEDWLTSLTAYGVAVSNGYKGDAASWLESLKAANEWVTLDGRTEILKYHNAESHNAFFRGKCLGDHITDEQSAAIRDDTFLDIYIGDYWTTESVTYTYYNPTADTSAQAGKTYYKDPYGTALDAQPETGADISTLGYFEAVSDTAKNIDWVVMDLNYFKNMGIDYDVHANKGENETIYFPGYEYSPGTMSLKQQSHALIMPRARLWSSVPMNDTDTNSTGYTNSAMRKKYLPRAFWLINEVFEGRKHLRPWGMWSSCAVDAKGVQSWHWFNHGGNRGIYPPSWGTHGDYTFCELPNAAMLGFGNPLYASGANYGADYKKASLAFYNFKNYVSQAHFWLQNPWGTDSFLCTQNQYGLTRYPASQKDAWVGVCPFTCVR